VRHHGTTVDDIITGKFDQVEFDEGFTSTIGISAKSSEYRTVAGEYGAQDEG